MSVCLSDWLSDCLWLWCPASAWSSEVSLVNAGTANEELECLLIDAFVCADATLLTTDVASRLSEVVLINRRRMLCLDREDVLYQLCSGLLLRHAW